MSAVTGGSVVDAFGESRWLGSVENTRAFGDGRWKGMGVTAEPQIGSRVISGQEYAFLIFVSDGVCSTIDDQEIVDLCRTAPSPAIAARAVINFAEDLNSQVRFQRSLDVFPF
jgi:protein phosphatase PTC6